VVSPRQAPQRADGSWPARANTKKHQAKSKRNDAFTHMGQSRSVCKSVVAGRSILGRPILGQQGPAERPSVE